MSLTLKAKREIGGMIGIGVKESIDGQIFRDGWIMEYPPNIPEVIKTIKSATGHTVPEQQVRDCINNAYTTSSI